MKYKTKPNIKEATQWFKNGDHPLDDCFRPFEDTGEIPIKMREGKIVRYFRLPGMRSGMCEVCDKALHIHGFIDTLEGGHRVCPGDYIITGIKGEFYPCKPDIFEASYEPYNEDLNEQK